MKTKVAATVGTIMLWFPILAPVLLTGIVLVSKRVFLFDYLMPAELFPIALIGAGLLFWAASQAHFPKKLIGWGICVAALSLLSGQVFAMVTGAVSGAMNTWQLIFIYGTIALYTVSILVIGTLGVQLLQKIFR